MTQTVRPAFLTRRRFALALPLLGGAFAGRSAWAHGPAGGGAQRASRRLMGTQVDIVAEGRDPLLLQHGIDGAFAEMARLEALMTRYRTDSVVGRINLAAGIVPVAVPPEVMAVLQEAQRVGSLTGGAFDITVGALRAWNFEPGAQAMPSPGQIARQLPLVDARALVLDARAGTAFLARQGMALDLGGIAKLPILEAGLQVLRANGIPNALVNGGGDVLTAGQWQGGPWRVGLRDPRDPARLLGVVPVSGTAVVASSGDYERFFFHQGQRQHHVLDPRTGRPTAGVHGVSLVARNVAEVNGLGAAMMVQGPRAARALAQQRLPGAAVLVAASDGAVWRSGAMASVLEPARS